MCGREDHLVVQMKLVALAALRPAPVLIPLLNLNWLWGAFDMLARRLEQAEPVPTSLSPSERSILRAILKDDFAAAAGEIRALDIPSPREWLAERYQNEWGPSALVEELDLG